jgi:peroxiredoxin
MGLNRVFVSLLMGAALACGSSVDQAAARVEQLVSQSPAALRPEFRILAAQALKGRHPELAKKFVRAVFDDVRMRDAIDSRMLAALAGLAPEETVALLPHLKPGSAVEVADAFMRLNQVRPAVALYRASLEKGQLGTNVAALFKKLAKDSPDDAKTIFADFLASFPFDTATPYDLFNLTNCADAIAPLDPVRAANALDRVLAIASAPEYGKDAKPSLTATFEIGSTNIDTTGSRETVMIAAGARLRNLAPGRFAKYQDALAAWDLAGAFAVKGVHYGAPPTKPARSPAEVAIYERLRKLRSLPDPERVQTVLELARAIEALPKGPRFEWALDLAGYATEGDNGREAMMAVVSVLGQGMRESAASAGAYFALASLVRYEHVPAPFSDVSLDAANAILVLRELIYQDASFSLTALDGKTYSLASLRGKVVLLNFWATWCPPCRKEMPDMEALYHRFEKKGLVILAVSEEDRETVAGFLGKQNYSFPILLDPDRKANDAFGVDGIPKSFIFDRQGKLVALAVDGRTESQFLELLKQAGLE